MVVTSAIDVFGENRRTVYEFHRVEGGLFWMVAVGALMVGSVVTTAQVGEELGKGAELGYFAFGGSTLVLLLPAATVTWDPDLLASSAPPANSAAPIVETLVKMGTRIGRLNKQ